MNETEYTVTVNGTATYTTRDAQLAEDESQAGATVTARMVQA